MLRSSVDGDKNDDNKCDGEMSRSSDDGDKNDDKCDGDGNGNGIGTVT